MLRAVLEYVRRSDFEETHACALTFTYAHIRLTQIHTPPFLVVKEEEITPRI